MSEFSEVSCRGRERQRRKVAQTIPTTMGDPLAQNVHVGKSAKNVDRVQLMSVDEVDTFDARLLRATRLLHSVHGKDRFGRHEPGSRARGRARAQPTRRLRRRAIAAAGLASSDGIRLQTMPWASLVASESEIQMGLVTPGAIAAGTEHNHHSPAGPRRPYVSAGNPGAQSTAR